MNFIRKRVRNRAEAEDVYQEAIARFARHLHYGEPPENPVGYFYRIALNIITDDMRRDRLPTESVDELADCIHCQKPQPDQHVNDQQCLALFNEQLDELPAITRNIIVMRKLHGRTNIEIAKQMGLSAKAVEKQLNRALKSIEEKMAKYMDLN